MASERPARGETTARSRFGRQGRQAVQAASNQQNDRDHTVGRVAVLNFRNEPALTGDDATADAGTRDRVHRWYSTHATQAPPARVAVARAPAAPDLSTSAPKATAEDFDRAAAAQRLTIRSAAEQNSRQTTAADDAADAESRIPSTAPTEREPAPFIHGDGPPPATPTGVSRRIPAPVIRQPMREPAAQVAARSNRPLLPPTPVRRASATSAESSVDLGAPAAALAAPGADASAPLTNAHLPIRPAAPAMFAASPDTASHAVTLPSASAAAPTLQQPVTRIALGRKPAINAVQAGLRRPVLDPAVAAGMSDETFDGDSTPATATTAVRLASGIAPRSQDEGTSVAGSADVLAGRTPLVFLPPMRGSHQILVHQNQMAVSDGLERIQNDRQMAEMRRANLLVDLPDDDSVYPNDALPLNRRYARPWTVRFIRDLARAHYTRFGTPLIVTSAVRTVEFQRRLVRINGNAAPPTGDIASPHLYGQAIDFAKHGMSLTEINWMRAYLGPVEDEGKIDVEEEFQQACFHISVYRRYLGAPPPKRRETAPAFEQATAPAQPKPSEKRHHLPTALLATHLP